MDMILHELEALEYDINRLLLSGQPFQVKAMEARLAELVEAIGCIPANYPDLCAEWSEKMATFMGELVRRTEGPAGLIPNGVGYVRRPTSFRVLADGDLPAVPSTFTRTVSCSSDIFGESPETACKATPDWDLIREQIELANTSFSSSDGGLVLSSSPPVVVSKELLLPPAICKPASPINAEEQLKNRAAEIRNQVFGAFNRLPSIRGPTDMAGFRKLLTITAKSKKLIELLGKRCPFYEELLKTAIMKMPMQMQEQYNQKEQNKQNLANLVSFLFSFIKTEADQSAVYNLDEYSNLFTCQYCKSTGHNVTVCASRKATFCLNCFEFGHSAKRCPAEPIRPEHVHF